MAYSFSYFVQPCWWCVADILLRDLDTAEGSWPLASHSNVQDDLQVVLFSMTALSRIYPVVGKYPLESQNFCLISPSPCGLQTPETSCVTYFALDCTISLISLILPTYDFAIYYGRSSRRHTLYSLGLLRSGRFYILSGLSAFPARAPWTLHL